MTWEIPVYCTMVLYAMQGSGTCSLLKAYEVLNLLLNDCDFCGLQVVKQCCGTDGVEPQYIKDEILPDFFKHFWQHRMALDRRNYRQVCIVNIILLVVCLCLICIIQRGFHLCVEIDFHFYWFSITLLHN